MNVHVLFFGPARTFAGTDHSDLTLTEGANVSTLRHELAERFDRLGPALPTIRFAVNQSFAGDDEALRDGDEVAVGDNGSGHERRERRGLVTVEEGGVAEDCAVG